MRYSYFGSISCSMNITIRQAIIEDAQIITLLSSQLGYTISEADTILNIKQLLSSRHDVVYVATFNEAVVGWIHVFYSVRIETMPFCEIGGMVVDEIVRGKGIGKLLIEKATEWSKSRSAETLRVRTNVTRTDTHKFYESVGFTLTKQQNIYGISLK